jgi:enoyl-CoA hydratase
MAVEVSREGDVCTVTIARPEALNALNTEVLVELESVVDSLAADERCKVVIVTGAGEKSFVAGADIAEMQGMSAEEARVFGATGNRVFRKLERLPQPTIAAVNGFALGGGCELALACDMRIASENARFGEPEVSLGIIPGFGGTQRMPRLVGVSRAMELILTGRIIDAQEALALGLVDRVVPAEELREECLNVARAIAGNGAHAVRLAKQAIRDGVDLELEEACRRETELFAQSFGPEQRERMAAFLEKRGKKS